MHLVEKVGNLILVTFEDDLTDMDIEAIKEELKKIAEVSHDDVVVSFNFSQRRIQGLSFTLEQKINELLKFCHITGLHVYSYRFE